MVLDLAVVFTAYFVPLVLRFGGEVPDRYWNAFWRFGAMACILHLLVNYLFGLYGQMWRFANIPGGRRAGPLGAGAAAGGGPAHGVLGRGPAELLSGPPPAGTE